MVQLSPEFRREVYRASTARLGSDFLSDDLRPDGWTRRTPFGYGLGQSTSGVNCSGLVIASMSDVLGRAPEAAWQPQRRTSDDFVQLVRGSADYQAVRSDFRAAEIGDLAITVIESLYPRNPLKGSHTMILNGEPADRHGKLSVIHADSESGVAHGKFYPNQRGRILVPLARLVDVCVIDSDKQSF